MQEKIYEVYWKGLFKLDDINNKNTTPVHEFVRYLNILRYLQFFRIMPKFKV